MSSKRLAPSTVRDRLESRIRKLSRSYSKSDQLQAVNQSIELLSKYRDQLVEDLGWEA
jgi:hypothetical protein